MLGPILFSRHFGFVVVVFDNNIIRNLPIRNCVEMDGARCELLTSHMFRSLFTSLAGRLKSDEVVMAAKHLENQVFAKCINR